MVPGCTGEGSQAAWNPVTTWPGRVQMKGTCARQAFDAAVKGESRGGRRHWSWRSCSVNPLWPRALAAATHHCGPAAARAQEVVQVQAQLGGHVGQAAGEGEGRVWGGLARKHLQGKESREYQWRLVSAVQGPWLHQDGQLSGVRLRRQAAALTSTLAPGRPLPGVHCAVRPLMGLVSFTVACMPCSYQTEKLCRRRGSGRTCCACQQPAACHSWAQRTGAS